MGNPVPWDVEKVRCSAMSDSAFMASCLKWQEAKAEGGSTKNHPQQQRIRVGMV